MTQPTAFTNTPSPFQQRGPLPIGRPKKDPADLLHAMTVRLTRAEYDKLARLGGRRWVSAQLAKVKDPK